MSREKLLWILSGGLAALAITLAVLLAQSTHPAEPQPPDDVPGPPTADEAVQSGVQDPESRTIARAGNTRLLEDEFIEGLRAEFSREFVQQWLRRTVVRLEAQALQIDVTRADIDEELSRMRIGYDSEAEYYRVMKEQLGLTEQHLREEALHRLMLEGIATYRVKVTEADVEQYIEEHPEEFAPRIDVRYAQIVTESKDQAIRVLEQLSEGVTFDLLAKDVSLDEATASFGGDSGWVMVNDPFTPYAVTSTLSSMAVGDVSPPIDRGDERWVILTLLGRRTIDPLDDSNVRVQLKRELALGQAPSLFDIEAMLLKKHNAVDFLGND